MSDINQSSLKTHTLLPDSPMNEVATWLSARLVSDKDVYWCHGQDDPVIVLSALSQKVSGFNFGILSSRLIDRPALLAARQLMTLEHLVDGELHVGIEEVNAFDQVAAHLRNAQSGTHLGPRPTLQV